MIIGIGTDIVDISRFERSLAKAPRLQERLFVESERGLPVESLAARFAAKEAVIKALGGVPSQCWHDVVVHKTANGKPELEVSGTAGEAAAASGINRWHISLTHDGGMAMAFIIGESV